MARVNTPEPKSCQLAGKMAMGASVKNSSACVARRMAFQPIEPLAALSAIAMTTTGERTLKTRPSPAAAAAARAAP